MKPGDKVSLVVRGRNPLEPQQFVDVTSLLAELQKGPPASDGAYHVFLAPPNYPSPSDGQKFDVTYVGAPPAQPGQPNNNAIHPPFFVAPLDYSVPHGYGRIQIPTRQVKFALGAPGGPTQFQPAPQQQLQQVPVAPPQLRQQQQPQFIAAPPGPPAASFQQQQQPQIQQPRPQFQSAFPPAPTPFQPVQQQLQPQFQSAQPPPPAPTPFQQQQPQIQPFLPNQAPPPPPPSAPFQSSPFDESLSGGRIQQQSGFIAPTQTLEEAAPPARPALVEVVQPLRPQEPLVLAVDKPEFLEFEQPRQPFVPLVIQDGPAPVFGVERPQTPVLVQVDPVALQEPRAIVAEAPVQIVPTAVVQQEEIEVVVQSTEPAATAPPTTTTEEVKVITTEAAPKKKPNIRLPEGAQPQWPDFQSVRRQQLNRQQSNRQKSNSAASADTNVNSFTSSASASAQRRPSSGSRGTASASADGEFTFGQKIRPKVKTNALVSPPEPVSDAPAIVAVQRPRKPTSAPVTTAAPVIAKVVVEKDPPVSEGDETFETLESQNAASSRGRIRFNRPEASDANAIPAAEVTTTAATPTVSSGRGRFRSTSAPAVVSTTTEEQSEEENESTSTTESPSEARGIEEESNEAEQQQVKADSLLTTTTETAAEEEEEEQQEQVNEEEKEVVSQAPVQVTTTAASLATAPVRNEKPWSPYEAIQRQRQSGETEKRNQPETSTGNQPIRIRGKATFASSRPTSGPVVRQEVNRPVVLRPSPPANRQPSSVQIVRPSRPIQPAVRVRDQQDFVAPVAPEFGIRGDQQQAKPILIVNQEPTQSLVPVGRRVPEVRPPGQFVRIVGRPSNAVVPATKAPTTTTAAPEEEEVEEEELEENENENEHEEEEEEEEEAVEEEQTVEEEDVQSSTTSTVAPIEVVAPSTTEAAQEVDDQSVNSTTAATTTSEPSEESEGAVESASGNNVDERQVLGVSTATEVSLMYELCYRGRCVRVHE